MFECRSLPINRSLRKKTTSLINPNLLTWVFNESPRNNPLTTKMTVLRSPHFFIISLLLLSIQTISQEREYIITNDNDTIYGKVRRSTNYLNTAEVRYKIKDEAGNKYLIDPAEVKFIRSLKGVDGDCLIATVYDEWFLKRIINGRIKVYQLVDGIIFFTSKDGSDIVSNDFGGLNKREDSKDRIRTLIQDNPAILEEFNALKGSQKDILYIIQKYNNSILTE